MSQEQAQAKAKMTVSETKPNIDGCCKEESVKRKALCHTFASIDIIGGVKLESKWQCGSEIFGWDVLFVCCDAHE